MFLDAATVLHVQPLQHLRCAWISMVQFDEDCEADSSAAASIVDACLAELVTSSLITISNHRYQQERPQDEDIFFWGHDEIVQRCVTSASATVGASNALTCCTAPCVLNVTTCRAPR